MPSLLEDFTAVLAAKGIKHSVRFGQQPMRPISSASSRPTGPQVPEAITADQAELMLAKYESALRSHDWAYQYSESPEAHSAGRTSFNALLSMAASVDPTFALWNHRCPAEYRRAPSPDPISTTANVDATLAEVAA